MKTFLALTYKEYGMYCVTFVNPRVYTLKSDTQRGLTKELKKRNLKFDNKPEFPNVTYYQYGY